MPFHKALVGGRDGEKDDIAFLKACPFNIKMLGFGFRLWETINAWHTFTDGDTTGCLGGMDISVAIYTLIYLVRVSPSF